MAGIGLAQLKRYPEMLYRRRQIIERYNEGLKGRNVQVLDHFGDDHFFEWAFVSCTFAW